MHLLCNLCITVASVWLPSMRSFVYHPYHALLSSPSSCPCLSIGDAIRGAYPGIDQNGFGFSTTDWDNDGCSPCIFGDIAQDECTFSKGGGWWYSRCGSASLNGDWHAAGEHLGWASGLHWLTWKGPAPYSARATRMMIKSVWGATSQKVWNSLLCLLSFMTSGLWCKVLESIHLNGTQP